MHMTAQDNLTTIEVTPVEIPEVPAAVPPVLETEAVPALKPEPTIGDLLGLTKWLGSAASQSSQTKASSPVTPRPVQSHSE